MFGQVIFLLLLQAPDLHPDLPPLSDVQRFGVSEKEAKLQFDLWYKHRDWVKLSRCYYPAWLAPDDLVMGETLRGFQAWDQLDNALRSHHREQYKRESLLRLRLLIGEENYRLGRMPPRIMFEIVYPAWPDMIKSE